MANIVIQVSSAKIEEMRKHYQSFLKESAPPGSVFSAKKHGCTITAYRSGKIMFQGPGNDIESAKWGEPLRTTTKKAARKTSGQPLPPNISSMSTIGSDEVGKGDYFGPLIVVAAYVKKEQIPLVKELGVQDSKKLTDPQIIQIAKDLLTFLPYSRLTLTNEKYNHLQSKGMTQGKMTAILHNQALCHLLKKIHPEKPEAILIDQFAEASVYFRHLQDQREVCRDNVFFSTQAEGLHLAVASASILARYAFLKEFERLNEKAGFSLTKGAGHKVDQDAARLIREKGLSALNQFTKLHFANTNKAKKIAGVL